MQNCTHCFCCCKSNFTIRRQNVFIAYLAFIAVIIIIPFLLFATIVINAEIMPPIRQSCIDHRHNNNSNTQTSSSISPNNRITIVSSSRRGQRVIVDSINNNQPIPAAITFASRSFCEIERQSILIFSFALLIRCLSYRFECLLLEFCDRCTIRQQLCVHHHLLGDIGLLVVYLIRQLSTPFIVESNSAIYIISYICLYLFAFVCLLPQLHDIYLLKMIIVSGYRSSFYTDQISSLFITILAMIIYLLLLIIIVIDLPSNYINLQITDDIDLSFPYVNYLLALYLLHIFILRSHHYYLRIYIIQSQNRFIYVKMANCINGETCMHNTLVFEENNKQCDDRTEDLAKEGQLVIVDKYDHIDQWIRDKIDRPTIFNR